MTGQETQGAPQGAATIQRLCLLAGVSRAGHYRHFEASAPARADADLRDAIQRISLAHRYYGYRRITAQLRREGQVVNAKRVLRLMREDNLLCLRIRPFVPHTTDSRHDYPIVPNLIRHLVPTGIDQIWVSDITYVRLGEAFIYLAVILDAFSRLCVGWALDDHLEARLAIEALEMALAARNPAPGSLIHHSDRGVQYASNDYVARLSARGIAVSMSRVANPYDNAKAESFMKTLKAEEVNGKAYATLDHARRDIGRFIDTVYNSQRLHSALGYKPPAEFEAELSHHNNPQNYAITTVSLI
ncbi:MAG TPA: IS3 family transposase [Allosphingosinicella sp.]|nr:IS3 family transposase [Allosphingosinicella sp.]